MKILLLNPPNLDEVKVEAESVPLGLLQIKEFLRHKGCQVELLNLARELSWDGVRRKLSATSFDIVGITCYTAQRLSVYRLAETCKGINPRCQVVLGGPHATFLDLEILRRIAAVDFIVRNEGEYTFLELVRALAGGGEVGRVKGLSYRDGDDVVRAPAREAIANLSELPPLRYTPGEVEDFRQSKALTCSFDRMGKDSRIACMINSRGCGNACLFCCNGAFWERQHYYPPEDVFRQIRYFHDEFGIRLFDFSDDDFLQSQSYVESLCELIIASGIDIRWWCAGRAQSADFELLKKMKKAGCFMVSYGFESGSPRILANIDKNVSIAEATRSAHLTKAAGLLMRCTLTVGNPGETEESIKETIDFLETVRPDQIGLYIMKVYPGTPIYRRFKEEGGITDDYWFDPGNADLPFYTSEHPLSTQLRFRDRIREELDRHVTSNFSDDLLHVQHLFLSWQFR